MYKTGVYAIVNKLNSKFYIGSAAQTKGSPSKIGFYARWSGHRCDLRQNKHHSKHLQNAWNKYGEENFEFLVLHRCPAEDCIQLEQLYLNFLCPHYNLSKTAGSNLGTKRTKEQVLKTSKKFYLVSPEGLVVEDYNISELARDNNLDTSSISSLLNNKISHHKGWTNSLENHLLYKAAYDIRGICKSSGGWVVHWSENKKGKSKYFKDLELAKNFRDDLSTNGYSFKVRVKRCFKVRPDLQQYLVGDEND